MTLKVKPNWTVVLNQFSKSGLSQAEFCRTHNLSRSSFAYHSKLKVESFPPSVPTKSSSFIAMREKQEFKVRINDSLTLSFETLPEPTWLSTFVRSLGADHAHS